MLWVDANNALLNFINRYQIIISNLNYQINVKKPSLMYLCKFKKWLIKVLNQMVVQKSSDQNIIKMKTNKIHKYIKDETN